MSWGLDSLYFLVGHVWNQQVLRSQRQQESLRIVFLQSRDWYNIAQFVFLHINFQAICVQFHLPYTNSNVRQNAQIIDFISVNPDDFFYCLLLLLKVKHIQWLLLFKRVDLLLFEIYPNFASSVTGNKEECLVCAHFDLVHRCKVFLVDLLRNICNQNCLLYQRSQTGTTLIKYDILIVSSPSQNTRTLSDNFHVFQVQDKKFVFWLERNQVVNVRIAMNRSYFLLTWSCKLYWTIFFLPENNLDTILGKDHNQSTRCKFEKL